MSVCALAHAEAGDETKASPGSASAAQDSQPGREPKGDAANQPAVEQESKSQAGKPGSEAEAERDGAEDTAETQPAATGDTTSSSTDTATAPGKATPVSDEAGQAEAGPGTPAGGSADAAKPDGAAEPTGTEQGTQTRQAAKKAARSRAAKNKAKQRRAERNGRERSTVGVDELVEAADEPEVVLSTIHAPIGGRAFAIGDVQPGVVLCGRAAAPWRSSSNGRTLVPPNSEDALGRIVRLKVAPSSQACAKSAAFVDVIATGRRPLLHADTVIWSADEGRVDGAGRRLDGAVLWWTSGEQSGQDVCHQPANGEGAERCTWSTGRGVVADPERVLLGVYPKGSRPGPDARFVDSRGRTWVDVEPYHKPARITVQRVFPVETSVDLSSGEGELPLIHAEAVASAACHPLDCEVQGDRLIVRGGTAPVNRVQVTLRMRPRVFVQERERSRTTVTATLAVLHCPMSIASGDPFRHNDGANVVVRLEGVCGRDVPRLVFRLNRRRLKVIETYHDEMGTLVLLHMGSISSPEVTITANREASGQVVVAVANGHTRSIPPLRAVLELPGYPNVDFIPTNRWARVHVAPPAEDVYAVAVPIHGVYEVRNQGRQSALRGDSYAAGLTGVRLGLRSTHLPEQLAAYHLALVDDPLLRSVHEANVPAPLVGETPEEALVELICGGNDDNPEIRLEMGRTHKLPFSMRDTCRVLFHRDRLHNKYGAQHIRFEMDVMRVDGGARGDAHVSEMITLSPGERPRRAYVHGVERPFDRLVVRVAHQADDTHYLGASQVRTGAPEAKWSIVFGTGRARLYATTAFPTGLYRLSHRDHSGVLSLNFGLLSRLTWLDDEGHEGFVGLESGLVVVGVGNAVTDNGQDLNQVGLVLGLGLSVPFANRSSSTQASMNVHAWLEVDITRDTASGADGRLAFIFGPSISIGNLGTNL